MSSGNTRTWAVSGYLPEDFASKKKSYVIIKGRLIENVGAVRPAGLDVLETESLIFPGLVDMHSHVKYNILPLWGLAKGQFLNRFEWRKKFAPYKSAVSFNMKAFPKETICAAVRWAEVKALTGGVTALQGIGNDGRCAADFGIHNIEIPGEFGNKQRIRSATDIIDPALMGAVYDPRLDPTVQKLSTQPSVSGESPENRVNKIYDQALLELMKQTEILDWMETFYNQPRSVKTGLRLLLGEDLGYNGSDLLAGLEAFKPKIIEFLLDPAKGQLNAKASEQQYQSMKLWLFGATGKVGYMQLPANTKPLSGLDLLGDSKTMDFFGKAGVIAVDKKVRRYLAMFEVAVRRSALGYLQLKDSLAIVAHLSEGMRNDAYNHSEYDYIRKLGLNKKGLVLIHAVGLDQNQLKDVAQRQMSIVWSPFSNLLLYGETLDIQTVKKLGINVALGADWTPTGSKNLLDELKIARRYLDKMKVSQVEISDRDLVTMATVNAGKALNLGDVVGQVKAGFQADLLLIDPAKLNSWKDPYSALVHAGQQDVDLVVVSGQPLYGSVKNIQMASTWWKDVMAPEVLPRDQGRCSYQKAFRNPSMTKLDKDIESTGQRTFRTVAGLEQELSSKLNAYRVAVQNKEPKMISNVIGAVDPLYACEDPAYTERFAQFIEKTLDQDAAERKANRKKYKLDDRWTPLGSSNSSAEEEPDDDL
ncbi:MAG: hypothetical protein COT73_01800 [Bdellovibrio sp. CG10_big_fil_rev_8_21_14_0_10_47_8]|nr:MAG: hypothetical protein COT73_01800 [Bdellovibrio sp. CG10_big_fil_rev_8_21_14_0_10_47_8]